MYGEGKTLKAIDEMLDKRFWLSLTHIDYENRIPRGATYARAGAAARNSMDDINFFIFKNILKDQIEALHQRLETLGRCL